MSNEELKKKREDAGEAGPQEERAEPEADRAEGEGENQPEQDESETKSEDGKDSETDAGQEAAKSPEEEALNTRYLRLMADFQNYKRRTEKEKSDIYAFANEKLVGELLNVIDNFERALEAGDAGDSFVEGMNLIFKQLQGVLEKAGVVEIEASGKDFDPNFHNAVMTEDSAEYESGKVTAVLQKGYLLNNKVIRPSMVKVAN